MTRSGPALVAAAAADLADRLDALERRVAELEAAEMARASGPFVGHSSA